jgi:hypothetical protein
MNEMDDVSLRSNASGGMGEWEPMYGFCATNVHSNEDLAKALEAVRRRVCAYGGGHGGCDCKYSRDASQQQRAGTEKTGCPELREIIHRLLHRPASFVPLSESPPRAENWPKAAELPDPDADFQAFREAAEEDAMRYAESQWEPLDISNLPSPDSYARAAVGYAILKAYLKPKASPEATSEASTQEGSS